MWHLTYTYIPPEKILYKTLIHYWSSDRMTSWGEQVHHQVHPFINSFFWAMKVPRVLIHLQYMYMYTYMVLSQIFLRVVSFSITWLLASLSGHPQWGQCFYCSGQPLVTPQPYHYKHQSSDHSFNSGEVVQVQSCIHIRDCTSRILLSK